MPLFSMQEGPLGMPDGGFGTASPDIGGALLGMIMGFLLVFIIIFIAFYIYNALAFMTIARKTNTPNGWLVWIPVANLFLMTNIAKLPWWVALIIVVVSVLSMIIPFAGLVNIGLLTWVYWKICKARNKPGWWSLIINVAPAVLASLGVVMVVMGALTSGALVYIGGFLLLTAIAIPLVFIGLLAWKD